MKVMQIRQGETLKHQGAITHRLLFSGTGNDEPCFWKNIIHAEVNLFLASFTHLEPLCGVNVQMLRVLFFLEKTFAAFKRGDI